MKEIKRWSMASARNGHEKSGPVKLTANQEWRVHGKMRAWVRNDKTAC